jgi:hypothetical protein
MLDQTTKGIYYAYYLRLHSLGMDINAAAATADVGAIDKAMKERNWSIEARIALKSGLAKIGVI